MICVAWCGVCVTCWVLRGVWYVVYDVVCMLCVACCVMHDGVYVSYVVG